MISGFLAFVTVGGSKIEKPDRVRAKSEAGDKIVFVFVFSSVFLYLRDEYREKAAPQNCILVHLNL